MKVELKIPMNSTRKLEGKPYKEDIESENRILGFEDQYRGSRPNKHGT